MNHNPNPVNPVNPVQKPSADSAPSAPSALNQSTPPPRGTRANRGRPLSRLAVLSKRQLEQVNAWLKEGIPCRKIVELCRTEFQKEIPYMTFVRYSNRTDLFLRQLEGLADSKEAAAELSQYAATGDPSFSTNTLELLEQQAFDLALAFNRDADADDLFTLKQLWALIHKARNTAVRERHAKVQETKCDLRAREIDLKKQLIDIRANRENTRENLPPNQDSDPITQNSSSSTQHSTLTTQHLSLGALPPKVIAGNRRHLEGLLSGQIKPSFIPPEIPCPDDTPLANLFLPNPPPPGASVESPNTESVRNVLLESLDVAEQSIEGRGADASGDDGEGGGFRLNEAGGAGGGFAG